MAKTKVKNSKPKKARTKKNELDKAKDKLSSLNKKYTELVDENNNLKDKQIRLLAEFDNFRKRTNIEKDRLINYDGEKIIKSLLSVFDDLDRTMLEKYEDAKSIQKGISIIISNAKKILDDNDVKEFSSIGEEFDPEFAFITHAG